jgi:hypothetical protein
MAAATTTRLLAKVFEHRRLCCFLFESSLQMIKLATSFFQQLR